MVTHIKNITFTICSIVIGVIEIIRKKIIEKKKNVINIKCRFPTTRYNNITNSIVIARSSLMRQSIYIVTYMDA